ncbi:MAG: hypothetical protein EZS28_008927 [Streblomastix strix]|uniref:Uncharacterized protein n=1 Tax=Streblomastix strix TaxID=222440 RepID=A0A5J4WKG7_9EUKA|nr:MAG: hypothetical protein EZS28_008927 [Streblomastix strix]
MKIYSRVQVPPCPQELPLCLAKLMPQVQRGEHPKPIGQIIFIIANCAILAIAIVFFVLFIYAAVAFSIGNIVVVFFLIMSLVLAALTVLGCLGSRYGPRGKEQNIICLIIYFFTLFLITGALFIMLIYFIISNNFIQKTIGSFGEEVAYNIAVWINNNKGVMDMFQAVAGEEVLAVFLMGAASFILVFGLVMASFMMGFKQFIMANMSFGSLFVIGSGIGIMIIGIVYKKMFSVTQALGNVSLILLIGGIIVMIIGIAGCVFSLMPDRCKVPLNIYVFVLVIVLGALCVFGLIIMLFPGMFDGAMKNSILKECVVVGSQGLFVDDCKTLYDEVMNTTCFNYQNDTHLLINKGKCSDADVYDKISNSILEGIMSSLGIAAFTAILMSIIFLYLVMMILIALNAKWGDQGVRKVDLLEAKQRMFKG